MSKLEETNLLIDYMMVRLKESNLDVNNTVILADIAKSLAMIADKLCDEKESVEDAGFIILSKIDILTLCDDKPVTVYVNKKPYVLCTDEYFEKQINEPQERSDKE